MHPKNSSNALASSVVSINPIYFASLSWYQVSMHTKKGGPQILQDVNSLAKLVNSQIMPYVVHFAFQLKDKITKVMWVWVLAHPLICSVLLVEITPIDGGEWRTEACQMYLHCGSANIYMAKQICTYDSQVMVNFSYVPFSYMNCGTGKMYCATLAVAVKLKSEQ